MKRFRGRSTMLAWLVLFVFLIQLMTLAIASVVIIGMFQAGILTPEGGPGFPVMIIVLLLSSLVIGTIMSGFIGRRPLRPFHMLTQATRRLPQGTLIYSWTPKAGGSSTALPRLQSYGKGTEQD